MRPQRALGRFLEACAASTAIVTLLPLVSAHWWLLDLFTHFRLQLIAVQTVLLVGIAVSVRSIWMPLLGLFLGANVLASWDYLLAGGSDTRATRDLRVMEANVRADNTIVAGLLAQIEQEQPDILVVVELTEDWIRRLAPIAAAYPYSIVAPREDPFGIGLFSKTPLRDERVLDFEGVPALDARIALADQSTRVIAVHAVPPTSRVRMAQQARQLERLVALGAAAAEPLLVVGDLNLTQFSPRFGTLIRAAGLRDALAGHGLTITWPTYFPLLGIAIDHCLLGAGWDSIAHRRQPAYGSDHYAIVVDLIRKPAS